VRVEFDRVTARLCAQRVQHSKVLLMLDNCAQGLQQPQRDL
jgi:hypothetical protein